jgi:hypothetical protein
MRLPRKTKVPPRPAQARVVIDGQEVDGRELAGWMHGNATIEQMEARQKLARERRPNLYLSVALDRVAERFAEKALTVEVDIEDLRRAVWAFAEYDRAATGGMPRIPAFADEYSALRSAVAKLEAWAWPPVFVVERFDDEDKVTA